jgi:hypothetical protein
MRSRQRSRQRFQPCVLPSLALALTLPLLAATADALAVTRYVSVALTTGANNGSSWENAYQGPTGLVTAIAAAVATDQIWVAAGTYKPTATTTRSISFTLKNGVQIYGGFSGDEALLAERDIADNLTVLSGDLLGNDGPPGSFTNNADNSFHVVNAASTNATAVLDGFTITGGNANVASSNQDRGGGILMLAGSNSTIRNCIFAYNRCNFGGGAGYINASGPTFTDCVFFTNRGGSFGGAFDQAISVTTQFTRCQFISNSAVRAGAVETFGNSNVTFTNCLFSGNVATGAGGGGALWIGSNSTITVRLCTITGNIANVNFAGIHNTGTSAIVTNSIIYGNTGPGGSQAVNQQINAAGGTNNVTYSNVQGGFAGTGNINANPLFEDQAGGDFQLGAGSPCIDAGNNAAVPAGVTTDLAGQPRFVDDPSVTDTGSGTPPIVDMGAYERQIAVACVGDTNDSGAVDVDDLVAVILAWGDCPKPPASCDADVNDSGTVDVDDLVAVILAWGPCL